MRFHLYCPQWEEMNDNDLLEVTSSEDSADEELKRRRERHNFHRTCVFFQKRFHKGPLSTPFCKFQSSTNPWTNLEELGETHRKSVHVQTKVWKSWKETPRPTEKGSVSNNVFFSSSGGYLVILSKSPATSRTPSPAVQTTEFRSFET